MSALAIAAALVVAAVVIGLPYVVFLYGVGEDQERARREEVDAR